MKICTLPFGNKIYSCNTELAELQHYTLQGIRIKVLLKHTQPEEISVELRSEMASNPFRHVRKSTGEFFAIDAISCIAVSKKAMTMLGTERGGRGKRGSKQSIVGVPHILPRKEKWELY